MKPRLSSPPLADMFSPAFLPTAKGFLFREWHASIMNRFLQVFTAATLLCGLGIWLKSGGEARVTAPLFLLQAVLYLASLFAVLIGLSSALGESEERPLLLSQPISVIGVVLGKFLALWSAMGTALLALILPAGFTGADWGHLLMLWLGALAVSGVFISLGLGIGLACRDHARSVIYGVSLWLAALFGFDLLAIGGLQLAFFQQWQNLWVALLMMNPLDAFRIWVLFSLEEIPAAAVGDRPLVGWWLQHFGLWLGCLSILWIALLLGWGWRSLNKR